MSATTINMMMTSPRDSSNSKSGSGTVAPMASVLENSPYIFNESSISEPLLPSVLRVLGTDGK
jgi:hypothetical protein